jgi:hypothetical protein
LFCILRLQMVKKFYNFLCETIFQAFWHVLFIFFASSLLANSPFLRSVRWPPTEPRTVTHARDHCWTLDFANAFVSRGVNSRAELVPSPRAYARNGAPRRWLGISWTNITKQNAKSVLGPLLFLLYTNDLHTCSKTVW